MEVLNKTNDNALIEEIFDLLYPEQAIESLDAEELTGELKEKITRAFEDYQSGNYITNEQMKEKVQQWLTK